MLRWHCSARRCWAAERASRVRRQAANRAGHGACRQLARSSNDRREVQASRRRAAADGGAQRRDRSPPGGPVEEGRRAKQGTIDRRPLGAAGRAAGQRQLSRALENQTEVDQDLRALLELLMSENRAEAHRKRKGPHPRVSQTDRRASSSSRKDIQGRTAGGDDAKRLAGEQGKVAGKTGELARRCSQE